MLVPVLVPVSTLVPVPVPTLVRVLVPILDLFQKRDLVLSLVPVPKQVPGILNFFILFNRLCKSPLSL